MADWDPFADPAESCSTADTEADDARTAKAAAPPAAAAAPANPWEDEVYVELSLEAAREAEAREAAQEEAAARRAEARQRAEREAMAREVAERERRVAARAARALAGKAFEDLSEAELAVARRLAVEDAALREALESARGAPQAVAAKREAAVREFYEQEASVDGDVAASSSSSSAAVAARSATGAEGSTETNFREAAARMMAAQMGIKVNFGTLAAKEARPVGLLFPDQGSRSLRLLSAARNLPGIPRMLEAARQLLGFDPLEEAPISGIWELFRGPEAIPVWLEETRLCQPMMFISALAGVERLRERRPGCLERCQAVAGLGLGELAALVVAGVLDFEAGLELAAVRGEAMQAAAEATPQRMLSIAGLARGEVDRLCSEAARRARAAAVERGFAGADPERPSEAAGADEDMVCQVAQSLFPGGFLCSGDAPAVEELLPLARAAEGCKQVTLLKAPGTGAFHTRRMASARARLLEAVRRRQGDLRPPRMDIYMCAGARRLQRGSDPAVAAELFCEQLTCCARWEEVVRGMLRDGVGEFVECGPMQQLRGMMRRIDEGAHAEMLSVDHVVKNERERAR